MKVSKLSASVQKKKSQPTLPTISSGKYVTQRMIPFSYFIPKGNKVLLQHFNQLLINNNLEIQKGPNVYLLSIILSHDLVEEKHSDDQETQDPPVGVCRVKHNESTIFVQLDKSI